MSKEQAKKKNALKREDCSSELDIVVYPGRVEVTERLGNDQVDELVRLLHSYGVDCELVFRAPCG